MSHWILKPYNPFRNPKAWKSMWASTSLRLLFLEMMQLGSHHTPSFQKNSSSNHVTWKGTQFWCAYFRSSCQWLARSRSLSFTWKLFVLNFLPISEGHKSDTRKVIWTSIYMYYYSHDQGLENDHRLVGVT